NDPLIGRDKLHPPLSERYAVIAVRFPADPLQRVLPQTSPAGEATRAGPVLPATVIGGMSCSLRCTTQASLFSGDPQHSLSARATSKSHGSDVDPRDPSANQVMIQRLGMVLMPTGEINRTDPTLSSWLVFRRSRYLLPDHGRLKILLVPHVDDLGSSDGRDRPRNGLTEDFNCV
ncbi:hypothetical protein BHM03_00025070, partial [Ensete ventricosum]